MCTQPCTQETRARRRPCTSAVTLPLTHGPLATWQTFLDHVPSGDLEVTVDFLTEVDKLVQLIECPIFTCKSLASW